MAIAQAQRPNEDGTQTFYADTADDVTNLPTDVNTGSICVIVNTGEVYMCSSTGSWIKW